MKITVIGGTGLIGSKLCAIIRQAGHDVLAAAPSMGVNAVTGEGLAAALANAQVVVDVSNSPSFADEPVLAFFTASTGNLIAAATAAGVAHYVALSVVGTERLQASGYFRAKLVQEKLIETSGLPYSILRATQFFEFVGAIVGSAGGDEQSVHIPSQLFRPIVSDDVAAALADVVLGGPVNGIREVGGPEEAPMADFAARWLKAQGDRRQVVADPGVPYFDMPLEMRSLVPDAGARAMTTRFDTWLDTQGRG